jgi:hypothetical protein
MFPPSIALAKPKVYYVLSVSDDETFVFKGRSGNIEIFKAKTYCFHVEKGDQVIFLEGGPDSVCVSAEFLDLRTEEKCEVWCE